MEGEKTIPQRLVTGCTPGHIVDWVGVFAPGAKRYRWKAIGFQLGEKRNGVGVVYPVSGSLKSDCMFNYFSLGVDAGARSKVNGWVATGEWDAEKGVLIGSFEEKTHGFEPVSLAELQAAVSKLDWFIRYQSGILEENYTDKNEGEKE